MGANILAPRKFSGLIFSAGDILDSRSSSGFGERCVVGEPRRHDRTERSRRKALRQINRIIDELQHLRTMVVNIDYALSKAVKLRNRLK